jgi:hypothetical protein
MSNDPNVFDPERAEAEVRRIHAEAKDAPDPAEALYAPGAKFRSIAIGTREHAELLKREEEWRKQNPRPAPPSPPCHVNPIDGTWESWMVERPRKADDKTSTRFEVIVDRGKYTLLETPTRQRGFDSDEALVLFCRRTTGEDGHGLIEYYGPPSRADLTAGDSKGTFSHSEAW